MNQGTFNRTKALDALQRFRETIKPLLLLESNSQVEDLEKSLKKYKYQIDSFREVFNTGRVFEIQRDQEEQNKISNNIGKRKMLGLRTIENKPKKATNRSKPVQNLCLSEKSVDATTAYTPILEEAYNDSDRSKKGLTSIGPSPLKNTSLKEEIENSESSVMMTSKSSKTIEPIGTKRGDDSPIESILLKNEDALEIDSPAVKDEFDIEMDFDKDPFFEPFPTPPLSVSFEKDSMKRFKLEDDFKIEGLFETDNNLLLLEEFSPHQINSNNSSIMDCFKDDDFNDAVSPSSSHSFLNPPSQASSVLCSQLEVVKELYSASESRDRLLQGERSSTTARGPRGPRGPYRMYPAPLREYIVSFAAVRGLKETCRLFQLQKKKLKRWICQGWQRKKGAGRKVFDKHMEDRLVEWVRYQVEQEKNVFPSRAKIREKAKEFAKDKEFGASKGWCDKFFARNCEELDRIAVVAHEMRIRNRRKVNNNLK